MITHKNHVRPCDLRRQAQWTDLSRLRSREEVEQFLAWASEHGVTVRDLEAVLVRVILPLLTSRGPTLGQLIASGTEEEWRQHVQRLKSPPGTARRRR